MGILDAPPVKFPIPEAKLRLSSFEDRFQRANGALGTAPSGHAWFVTGNSPPVITDKKMAVALPAVGATTSSTGYASVTMTAPAPRLRARFTVLPGGGIDNGSTIGLLVNDPAKGFLEDLIHCVCTTTNWGIQIVDGVANVGGVTVTTLSAGTFPALAPGDYTVSISISGNTITLIDPVGGLHNWTDSRFGAFWGARSTYEILHSNSGTKEIRFIQCTELRNPAGHGDQHGVGGSDPVLGIGTLPAAEAWRLVGAAGQPAFSPDWSNYGGAYSPVQFLKYGPLVVVQGLAKKAVSGVAGETIFTLPAGYVPSGQLVFSGISGANTIERWEIKGTGSGTPGAVIWGAGIPTSFFSLNAMFALL